MIGNRGIQSPVGASYEPAAIADLPRNRSGRARSIPSLDGLRSVSIGLVIASHAARMSTAPQLPRTMETVGTLGVRVFFVISGFLITTLLLEELNKRGSISLRNFYLRRTLRIFPAYYAFLLLVTIAIYTGSLALGDGRMWPAWSYVSNFFDPNAWMIGHTWSLSVEEQFYLCWPLVLTVFGRRRAARFAIAAIFAAPAIRCALYLLTHSGRVATNFNFDFLAAGCCLALFWPRVTSGHWWRSRWTGRALLLVSATIVVLHVMFEEQIRWKFLVDLVVILPVEAVSLAALVAWCILQPGSMVGRILNLRVMGVVGALSYSLYLWQQLFFRPGSTLSPVVALAATLFAAGASYLLVERPVLALRGRVLGIFGSA